MRPYMNPSTFVEAQQKRVDAEKLQAKKFPERPQRDVLSFLLEHAPLEDWERDILAIVREEAACLAPSPSRSVWTRGSRYSTVSRTTEALAAAGIIDAVAAKGRRSATQQGKLKPPRAGMRVLPGHRRPLEQGSLRQGLGRLRRPALAAPMGQETGRWKGKDLRGAQALQRHHLHRRLPHS